MQFTAATSVIAAPGAGGLGPTGEQQLEIRVPPLGCASRSPATAGAGRAGEGPAAPGPRDQLGPVFVEKNLWESIWLHLNMRDF